MAAFSSSPPDLRRPRGGVARTLLVLLWWGLCRDVSTRAATGLLGAVAGGAFVPLLSALFLLFLSVLGVVALDRVGRQERVSLAELLCLPRRATERQEWALGAAVGWAVVAAAVLPLVFLRALRVQGWVSPLAWLAAGIAVLSLLASTLATEMIFRGYAFRQLERSFGPNRAMVLLSLLYGVAVAFALGSISAFVVSFLLAMLLATGWRRTHGVWLPWGLHFAWSAALGILFGLPLFEGTELSNVVQSHVSGYGYFRGGGLGPIASRWTMVLLVVAAAVVVRLTRDFAWRYTHRPIVAAGYPMEVPPPPAHRAMEGSSAAPSPPPLVQILPSTSQEGTLSGPLNVNERPR